MTDIHLKFENELTAKRKALEAKRVDFDTKIEKWERNHVKTKMAWAESSVKRINELEESVHKQSIDKQTEQRTSSPAKNPDGNLLPVKFGNLPKFRCNDEKRP